jgi:hypothetical protein
MVKNKYKLPLLQAKKSCVFTSDRERERVFINIYSPYTPIESGKMALFLNIINVLQPLKVVGTTLGDTFGG